LDYDFLFFQLSGGLLIFNQLRWCKNHLKICRWILQLWLFHPCLASTFRPLVLQWFAMVALINPIISNNFHLDFWYQNWFFRLSMNISCSSFKFLQKCKQICCWNCNSNGNVFLLWFMAFKSNHRFIYHTTQLYLEIDRLLFLSLKL